MLDRYNSERFDFSLFFELISLLFGRCCKMKDTTCKSAWRFGSLMSTQVSGKASCSVSIEANLPASGNAKVLFINFFFFTKRMN